MPMIRDTSLHRDPHAAFQDAIRIGRLSEDEHSANFGGRFMYMGHTAEGKALFKNTQTREYLP